MKQCTCGRSNAYPYCDGTHKLKKTDLDIKKEEKEE
jgi:CDGSH-type Zn-finger protein